MRLLHSLRLFSVFGQVRRAPRRLTALVSALVLVALLAGAGVTLATHAPQRKAHADAPAPVTVLLHGYDLTNTGQNCASYWQNFLAYASSHPNHGQYLTVGHYTRDTNCGVNISPNGGVLEGGPYPQAAATLSPKSDANGVYDHDTAIEFFSYHLAWFIYDTYTVKGTPVNIVAHSMGGLITAYMVNQVVAKTAGWPKSLYLGTIVTANTPFGGSGISADCGTFLQVIECKEMASGSAFQATLAYGATKGGAYWVTLGSTGDPVGQDAGTHGGQYAIAQEQVIYSTPDYGHGDLINDAQDTEDATVSYTLNSAHYAHDYTGIATKAGRGIRYIYLALQGSADLGSGVGCYGIDCPTHVSQLPSPASNNALLHYCWDPGAGQVGCFVTSFKSVLANMTEGYIRLDGAPFTFCAKGLPDGSNNTYTTCYKGQETAYPGGLYGTFVVRGGYSGTWNA